VEIVAYPSATHPRTAWDSNLGPKPHCSREPAITEADLAGSSEDVSPVGYDAEWIGKTQTFRTFYPLTHGICCPRGTWRKQAPPKRRQLQKDAASRLRRHESPSRSTVQLSGRKEVKVLVRQMHHDFWKCIAMWKLPGRCQSILVRAMCRWRILTIRGM
jgi:hypothetical protein